MADILLTGFALLALLAGTTLVAAVTILALGGFMRRLPLAVVVSMLMMGLLLSAIGLSPPGNPWPVVLLVGLSHLLAVLALWWRGRGARG